MKVPFGPDWRILRGWIYGSHCSAPYKRIGSISWEKSWFIVFAKAVLSSMDLRAYAALVALVIMTELRSTLELDRQRPR